jgi:hypothetical protein
LLAFCQKYVKFFDGYVAWYSGVSQEHYLSYYFGLTKSGSVAQCFQQIVLIFATFSKEKICELALLTLALPQFSL